MFFRIFIFFSAIVWFSFDLYLLLNHYIGDVVFGSLLTPSFLVIAALFGIEIQWKDFVISLDKYNNSFPFGLKINSIRWEHDYKLNGDFVGKISYSVTNKTKINLINLLPDKASWFGHNINPKYSFEILNSDMGFYNLEKSNFLKSETRDKITSDSETDITDFNWYPIISHGLQPCKKLEYRINIHTSKTEQSVLEGQESFAGMGTFYNANKISCKINAPEGYRLIDNGYIIRDRIGIEIEREKNRVKEPKFLNNGESITWEVKYPIPTALYLIRVKLEKNRK